MENKYLQCEDHQHGVIVKKFSQRLTAAVLASLAFTSQAESNQLELEKCFVEGVKSQALCGVLDVAENPNQALSDTNKVPLNIVVLPKFKEESKALPVMFLAGGPGQAATELAGVLNKPLWEVRQQHDIILVDQRGTGKSNGMRCPEADQDGLSINDEALDMKQEVAKCLAEIGDRYLPSYSTYQAVEDFEAVREALGHKQIHIIGGSYGTRSGFAYLKNHPESIKTATLDSTAPMDMVIGFFGKHAESAFDLLIEDCQAHPHCVKAFPDLKQDYLTLLDRVSKGPIEQEIYHPKTGEKVNLLLTKSKITGAVRSLMYNLAPRQIVPFAVHRAAQGDYRSLAALMASESPSSGIYSGLMMNIVCNEDMPRATPDMFVNDADNYFDGKLGYSTFTDICEHWPKWQAPADFAEPVKTSVPVLLFSGKYDPVTPPKNAELALPHLDNAKHVVIENGAHVPSLAICMEAIESFLSTADLAQVDFACAKEPIAEMFLTDLNQIH